MGPVASIPTRTASTLQTAIKRVGLAALVIQSPLREQLAGLFPGHGNLLIACVKITSYNQHCSAPFPEPWSSNSCQVYSVEGADAVIQSACIRAAPLTGDFWEPCVTCPVSAVVSMGRRNTQAEPDLH